MRRAEKDRSGRAIKRPGRAGDRAGRAIDRPGRDGSFSLWRNCAGGGRAPPTIDRAELNDIKGARWREDQS